MKSLDLSKSFVHRFEPYQGQAILLAFEGYEQDLRDELLRNPDSQILWEKDRLFLIQGWIRPTLWSQSHWLHPQRHDISSIGDAQKILRKTFPRWALHSIESHRRSQLIQEGLNSARSLELGFMEAWSKKNHGAWTLSSANELWCSTEIVPKNLPLGLCSFHEDKVNPPSRAYTKLWELFTIHGIYPEPGQRVIDMGSSPGGWTWVLQQRGCHVVSVDKAPLAPQVAKLPNITTLKKDAFSLRPEDVGPIDWFFSDIICYPMKLYELVEKWRSSGLCHRFVCSIKFQGATDFEALEHFARLPHSQLIHLNANKHEVTWISAAEK